MKKLWYDLKILVCKVPYLNTQDSGLVAQANNIDPILHMKPQSQC